MKRRLLLAVLIGLAWLGATPSVRAQDTDNFTITSFTADYRLGRTDKQLGTLAVDEVIVARFPDFDQNHGILRAIPQDYKDQPLDVQVQGITDAQGKAWKYTTSTSNGNLVLKIGNADKYVRGEQTYRIRYTLKNVVSFQPGHDELYWDVNGDDWGQRFERVEARVHIPAELAGALQERQACFAGRFGSTAGACTISRTEEGGGVVVTTSAANLPPKSTLTFVLGFTKDTFAVDAEARLRKQLAIAAAALGGIIPPVWTVVFVIRRWRKYGRDPQGKGVIVPQYTPPDGLNALTGDTILHEAVRSQAVTALIVELAIRGHIALYEVETKKLMGLSKKTEYELELTKDTAGLKPEEQTVMSMIFGGTAAKGARIKLGDLKAKAYQDIQKLGKEVPVALHTKGYFSNDPVKARNAYYVRGGILLGLSTFGVVLVGAVGLWAVPLLFGLSVAGLTFFFVAGAMPARSQKGVEARDHLLGLRDYIALAEADRLQFLQSPEGVRAYGDPSDPHTKIKLFEKLLPYAMLFGLEKDWAKQFEGIYTQAPNWYHGNWSSFSTGYLVGSLGGFSSASTTNFSPPQSSGGSGFSGGSAGGGGGGGGGGGW